MTGAVVSDTDRARAMEFDADVVESYKVCQNDCQKNAEFHWKLIVEFPQKVW